MNEHTITKKELDFILVILEGAAEKNHWVHSSYGARLIKKLREEQRRNEN